MIFYNKKLYISEVSIIFTEDMILINDIKLILQEKFYQSHLT